MSYKLGSDIDAWSSQLLTKLATQNKEVKAAGHFVQVNIEEVEKAILYCKKHHEGQTRFSGDPYYTHPIEVASITSEYIFDTNAIVAALLHDVVEDTGASLSQIKLIFCDEVGEIVDRLTNIYLRYKLSSKEVYYKINSFNHLNNIEQKAVIIKIIDRLHNMRTIDHVKSIEKRKDKAMETLQLFIPLARYANLRALEEELQTIATRVLNS